MVDQKLKEEKLDMWKKKLEELEKDYETTMEQRGEAASMGDLRENAAYQMLTEQGEVLSVRIGETQKIIHDLEGDPESLKGQGEK